jgi:hypothetical protein
MTTLRQPRLKILALDPKTRQEVCEHPHVFFSGRIPNTGALICSMCGSRDEELKQPPLPLGFVGLTHDGVELVYQYSQWELAQDRYNRERSKLHFQCYLHPLSDRRVLVQLTFFFEVHGRQDADLTITQETGESGEVTRAFTLRVPRQHALKFLRENPTGGERPTLPETVVIHAVTTHWSGSTTVEALEMPRPLSPSRVWDACSRWEEAKSAANPNSNDTYSAHPASACGPNYACQRHGHFTGSPR